MVEVEQKLMKVECSSLLETWMQNFRSALVEKSGPFFLSGKKVSSEIQRLCGPEAQVQVFRLDLGSMEVISGSS